MRATAILFLLAECTAFEPAAPEPVLRSVERWLVVFGDKGLAASAALTTAGDTEEGRVRLRAAIMREARRLYAPFRIELVTSGRAPNRVDLALAPRHVSWHGRVRGIDRLNLSHDQVWGVALGVLLDNCVRSAGVVLGYLPTPELAGRYAGVVLAHEIGHALGLQHLGSRSFVLPGHVMAALRGVSWLMKNRPYGWRYDTIVYLSVVLGLRPGGSLLGALDAVELLG